MIIIMCPDCYEVNNLKLNPFTMAINCHKCGKDHEIEDVTIQEIDDISDIEFAQEVNRSRDK